MPSRISSGPSRRSSGLPLRCSLACTAEAHLRAPGVAETGTRMPVAVREGPAQGAVAPGRDRLPGARYQLIAVLQIPLPAPVAPVLIAPAVIVARSRSSGLTSNSA